MMFSTYKPKLAVFYQTGRYQLMQLLTLLMSTQASSRFPTKLHCKLVSNIFLHRGMTDISGSASQDKGKEIKTISKFLLKVVHIHHQQGLKFGILQAFNCKNI